MRLGFFRSGTMETLAANDFHVTCDVCSCCGLSNVMMWCADEASAFSVDHLISSYEALDAGCMTGTVV